ncbi:response regulator transcription factor [Azospirillum sp. ST 5-10]|uniref:response regulator transcription factor n=1 Tax=unclassified Azospirillum TaxID=2630922 RepID=UPI003F49FF65
MRSAGFAGGGVPSLMVVEDDEDMRALLVESLQLQGIDVRAVGTALDLYRTLADSDVDAVIVDLGLPDLDGFNIASFLRQQTDLGVIAISANDSAETRRRFFECGADLFFAKPLDCRELAAAARGLIQRLRGPRSGIAAPPRLADGPDCVLPAPPSPAPLESAEPPWLIDTTRLTITAPDGRTARLAAKEMRLVLTLSRMAGTPITRTALRDALEYPDSEHGERSLEALVHRVRNKLRPTGSGPSPILTVFGSGYQFAGHATVR